jgi:hypothetical protein
MAIAKRPNSNQADIDAFIAGASPAPRQDNATDADKRIASIIRFPPDMLRKIDAAAKSRGVSRAAWVTMVASKALDTGAW